MKNVHIITDNSILLVWLLIIHNYFQDTNIYIEICKNIVDKKIIIS